MCKAGLGAVGRGNVNIMHPTEQIDKSTCLRGIENETIAVMTIFILQIRHNHLTLENGIAYVNGKEVYKMTCELAKNIPHMINVYVKIVNYNSINMV